MSSSRDPHLETDTTAALATPDATRRAVLDRRRFAIVALATLAASAVGARAEAALSPVLPRGASHAGAPGAVIAQRMGGGAVAPMPSPVRASGSSAEPGSSGATHAAVAPATHRVHRTVRRPRVVDEGSRMK